MSEAKPDPRSPIGGHIARRWLAFAISLSLGTVLMSVAFVSLSSHHRSAPARSMLVPTAATD